MSTPDARRPNPFPGLRPFRSDEHHLFFGREEQTAALLQLLRANRFLAVVGTSGSGKSSLVRAGLIAGLHGGTMTHAGSAWEVMVLRPGGSPVENLARAFAEAGLYDAGDPSTLPRLLATLGRSRYGLVEAMKQSELFEPGTNLLVVVDQFEELFRFRQQGVDSEEAAAAFVNLLLTASAQSECPIYVALTMRSDYLGDCSEVPGLAEAVNAGEYLIPRLLRDQKRDAIEKPVGVGGAKISPLLVQRLLNEVGDDPDQLPVLQHALMRTWDVWSAGGDSERPIDFVDFEATGGLASALSNHADEIYDSLPDDRHRACCERVFKTLTEKGDDNRGIRRPTRLARLRATAATDRDTAAAVLDAFRGSGVTFLMPGAEVELDDRTVLDLSHESLMRGWQRLRGWVEAEAQSARIFRRLSDTARLWGDGKAGLFRDPDLQVALSWREQERPNADWAEQYGGDFDAAIAFLQASGAEAEAERQARESARRRELEQARELAEARRVQLEQQRRAAGRLHKLSAGLAVVAVLAALACAAALTARNEERARQNATRAEQSQAEADQARAAAEKSRAAAEAETYVARLSEVRALRIGHEPGWRGKALTDLARLAVMPTPRRDLPELRTEAAATLGSPDIQLVARIALPPDGIGSFSFSPDGKTLMTADNNAGLDFWDVPGRRHASSAGGVTLREGILQFDKALYLPDGLVVATRDRGVVFLDKQGAPTARAPITNGASQPIKLGVSGNGERIAVVWGDNAGITVHDAASGALVKRFGGSSTVFALSPDGKWLARHENPDVVLLPIDAKEPRVVLGRHGGANGLAFSPNGAMLAAASSDHTTVVWSVARREQIGTLRGHREVVFDVAFSPDGEWIATGSLDYTTRIWETRTGQNVATLPGFGSPSRRVSWSPTGEYLAVGLNNSHQIALYAITGRNRVRQWLIGHNVELKCVAAHPKLERITTSGYAELITWDLSAARPSPDSIGPNPGAVTSVAYSPDGSLLAVCSGKVVLRDGTTGKVRGEIAVPTRVDAMAFDPTSERLVCGDLAGRVTVWDVATGRRLQQFATGSSIWSIAVLDHPRRVVAHSKKAVFLFNLETNKEERKLEFDGGVERLVADRAGSRLFVGLASGAIASLSLPDLTPGPRLEKAHEGSVECMALSPDGRLLATGGADRRVVLRDAKSFETLLRFPVFDAGRLTDLTFDAKGRRLAILGTGGEVDLWDLDALRDGLAELGLAWDRPPPAVVPAPPPDGDALRPAVPVIRRPGTDPAELEQALRLLQSGVAAFEAGRRAEAIRDLQQARDRLRALHKAAPGGQVASQLAISLGFLGAALRDEMRPAEALDSFKDSRQVLEAIGKPTSTDLYNLACAYSNLTTLAAPGSPPPTADEREALAVQAVNALRRAIAAGMKEFALMDRDHDLDPLRERPDFRALILESSGRTREAVPHLAAMSAADPKDTALALKVAVLQAWFGQEKEYAATRQRILASARGTDNAITAERAARACSILPSADEAELEAALAIAGGGVKLVRGEWTLLALGMAEYRSGNYAAADKALLAAAEVGKNTAWVTGISAFYRAMSLFRQGKPDEARKLAIAAAAKMKPLPKDENNPPAGSADRSDLILWLAYKEAKALIQFDKPTPAAPPREIAPPPRVKK